MMILALDIASTTGWTLGRPEDVPRLDTFDMTEHRDRGRPFMFALFREWFNKMIDKHGVDIVVIEAPILTKFHNINMTRILQGLIAIAESTAYDRGIPLEEYGVGQIKKTLTGKGNAKKDMMLRAARARGVDASNDHEADSFGAWLRKVSEIDEKQVARFDPINRGQLA